MRLPWRRKEQPARPEPPDDEPIPPRFRPLIEVVVARLAARDYDGLLRDGLVRDDNPDFAFWVEDYPATLVPLPADAWTRPERASVGRLNDGTGWYFVLDLWTREEGRSDLSLEGTLLEKSGGVRLVIDNIHVM